MTASFLPLRCSDQGRRHADRSDEIGRDRIDQQFVVDPAGRLIWQHDAGVVDEHVEVGMFGDQLGRRSVNARVVGDVELDSRHAGIGGDDLIEVGSPAPRDDHLVATLVERFGKRPPDA